MAGAYLLLLLSNSSRPVSATSQRCRRRFAQGEDLTTYGELVAEGSFRVYGAKGPRHVFLLDRVLLICKRKEDGSLGYKAHILVSHDPVDVDGVDVARRVPQFRFLYSVSQCSNLMLIESVPGEPLSFHVIPFDNPRQQYTLEVCE